MENKDKRIIRHPAHLVPTRTSKIEKHRSSKLGTYRTEVTVELALKFPDRQLTPRDIAAVHYGRANNQNEKHVRQNLWRASKALQERGVLWFNVYNNHGHGETLCIKRYRNDETDVKAFDVYLKKAVDKKEITAEQANRLEALAAAIRAVSKDGS
jgi:hypothetical protein